MAQSPDGRAWAILLDGITGKSAENRAAAARALGLIVRNGRAASLAEQALSDAKPEVRAAAAAALGSMEARDSIPQLQKAVEDKDILVSLAAAQSLIALGDNAGYHLYYEVLTGESKTGAGRIDEHLRILRNPKKMVWFSLEQGMNFVPFGAIGYGAVKALRKDEASLVRASAAKTLAKDPDPQSGTALIRAASDKSWIVRAAALQAIALREDPALLPKIEPKISDEKPEVRYIAAAAIVRLSGVSPK
jgi:HEAT repeat protein